MNRSTLSVTSSLTFTEIDTNSDMDDSSQVNEYMDPFLESHPWSDRVVQTQMPSMPQRRQSGSALSVNSANLRHVLGTAADAAPSMPTRQQSVADAASSFGDLNDEHLTPTVPIWQPQKTIENTSCAAASRPPSPESLRSRTSTMSTMEPMPDYLQRDFTAELNAQRGELVRSASIFRSIVVLADRKYNLRTYKGCFVGSEAVDKMLESGLASTRKEAVNLGRAWMTHLGLFSHVRHAHMFKDKYLFYRFENKCDKNPAVSDDSSSCDGNDSNDTNTINRSCLVRSTLARQKRHSAPCYALRQRTTILEDEVMEYAPLGFFYSLRPAETQGQD